MNTTKRTGTALFLYFLVSALTAQDFQMTAFVDYYGGIEVSTGYKNLQNRIFMRPRFSGEIEKLNLTWVLSGTLWAQPAGKPAFIPPWDILHEAYLHFPADYFDITLGQKIVTYGFADVFGPLNVLHSTNRVPFSLDDSYDSRRPDPLVQIRFYPSFEDTIEFTYIPLSRPDKERLDPVDLPDSQDRVQWSRQPYLTGSPHSFYLNYSHYGEKIDLQFFYAWYTENTPDFEVPVIHSTTPSVIRPVYNKKHTFGFAYSTRLGGATLSQDFAFNLTGDFKGTDIGAQNSDITINTQLLFVLPFNILSQYSLVYSYFFNHNKHQAGDDEAAAAYLAKEIQGFHLQPLAHIAFIIAHFERAFFRERLKAALNVGFFFSPQMYFGPRIAYSLSDYVQVESGVDIILGDPPSADLRRNPSNDNFYIRLVYRY